jgi:site-specific recombinase XerD
MNVDNAPFKDEIIGFLRFKRNMGFKYVREEGMLWQFSLFCKTNGWEGPALTKEIVSTWCGKRSFETERGGGGHCARVTLIRQFGFYLQSVGHKAYLPMNAAHNMSRHSRYVAYVFTQEEVKLILDAADSICPHAASTMHLVMPTLLRLLYSSGTRITETLSIQMKDVYLDSGVIRLKTTKDDKERLIALSPSMAEVLKTFCAILHDNPLPEDYLFCNYYGERYNNQTVYNRFRKMLIEAGIPHGGRGAGPRVHDIRHSFSCHTLMKAVSVGIDLEAMLPVLAEYLGHASVSATSQYLQMTSEVYPDIMELVERACSHIIPEVIGDAQETN